MKAFISLLLVIYFTISKSYVNPGLLQLPATPNPPRPLLNYPISSYEMHVQLSEISVLIVTDVGTFNETFSNSAMIKKDIYGDIRFHFESPENERTPLVLVYALERNLNDHCAHIEQDAEAIELVFSVPDLRKAGLYPTWFSQKETYMKHPDQDIPRPI
eukprot:TRINITY_DN6138_c0_g1_i1.p1 TRINITY_DN6138_c0_g1~~TRINITY_DN6138_c0_g1_i1.p1  ORF type:complete len:159 (-),score=2.63 TRINITY_DN6138_c0_g1_i1:75-551(-)